MTRDDIAVIGGGIVGASIAYHLSEHTDRDVTVYERQSVASETTTRSASFVGYYGGESETRLRMKRYGIGEYNRLLSDPVTQATAHTTGRLTVATTSEGAAELETATGETDASAAETTAQYFTADELRGAMLLPDLNFRAVRGASYRPYLSYSRPAELAHEFVERAKGNGVTFTVNTSVERVRTDDGRVTGVETERGTVRASDVVCAAGPWSRELLETAGLTLPVENSLGSVLVLNPSGPLENTFPSVKHRESGLYLRHKSGGRVFLGHRPDESRALDPDRVSDTVDADLRRRVAEVVPSLLPALEDATVEEEWVGVRTLTPDPDPILGATDVDGLYVTAFNGDGVMLAPAAGRIVRRQLLDDDPTECYPDVALSRFDGHGDRFD